MGNVTGRIERTQEDIELNTVRIDFSLKTLQQLVFDVKVIESELKNLNRILKSLKETECNQ